MSLSTTSALAGHWYAVFLCAMGHVEQAMQAIRHAQLLDPLSVTVQVSVGRCFYYERRYDDADRVFRDHLRLNPGSIQGYVSLIRNCIARGAFDEAVTVAEQGMSAIGRAPLLLALAGQAHGGQGRRGAAEGIIVELRQLATRRYVPPLYEGMIHLGLGDLDTALTFYEAAYEQRAGWLVFLKVDPTYDCLRAEPRFIHLVKRMRLDY
jgi:serine/threonine-protein kinase